MALLLSQTTLFSGSLADLGPTKLLINTINAHSYNVAQQDLEFAETLIKSDVLLPDGISVVFAAKYLAIGGSKRQVASNLKKIAGEDLFYYEMRRLESMFVETMRAPSVQQKSAKALFLGSSESTLQKIKERAALEFPNVEVYTFSPPYKPEFSETENEVMINRVNAVKPDVLFVGMTAPKQEKWAYKHFESLHTGHVCCIGAVFDFYAGTVKRAPQWIIKMGLEWLYRLIKEPQRMWRRYLVGNTKFLWGIMSEKVKLMVNNITDWEYQSKNKI